MTKLKSNTNISQLIAKRKKWEGGTFKASNDELYDLLGDCYDYGVHLRSNRAAIRQLKEYLQAEGYTVKANTSLETQIVRAVFGDMCKRQMAYVKVLNVARFEKPSDQSMSVLSMNAVALRRFDVRLQTAKLGSPRNVAASWQSKSSATVSLSAMHSKAMTALSRHPTAQTRSPSPWCVKRPMAKCPSSTARRRSAWSTPFLQLLARILPTRPEP